MNFETSNRALKFYNKGDFSTAMKNWKKMLKDPLKKIDRADVVYNIGLCYLSMEKFEDSLNYFQKANELFEEPIFQWHIALSYLNLGKFEEAKEFYKARYKHESDTSVRFPNFFIPQFSNQKEWNNKKVLVMNEQGFGDEILFSTKFKEFSESVDSATIKVSRELLTLFQEIYVDLKNLTFKSFDTISYEEVTKYDGFLASGDLFFDLWKKENLSLNLWKENNSGLVGVCWKANSSSPNHKLRSMEHSQIIKGIENWTSLQFGEFGFEPKDFLDTFKKLKELESVVTIDTSVAHLCGLIGIPTKLIINSHFDWRWKFNTNLISNFYHNVNIVV